jgi:hypothetical protein
MVLPVFYTNYDTTKLKTAGYFAILISVLLFINQSIYLYGVENIKWTSETLKVQEVEHYKNYPPAITEPFFIGISYIVHTFSVIYKFTTYLFIAFVGIYLITSKSKGSFIYRSVPIFFFIADFVKLCVFVIYLIGCNNYALCRSKSPPYSGTTPNTTFVLMIVTSAITVIMELIALLAVTTYDREVKAAVRSETKEKIQRKGSKLLEYLPLPSFYYVADESNFTIVVVYLLTFVGFVITCIKLAYKDRLVWISDSMVYTSIEFMANLPSWIVAPIQINYGDLYQIYFFAFDIIGIGLLILPFFAIAGNKRRDSYRILTILMVAGNALLFLDILLKTIILATCKSNAVCRTQYKTNGVFLESEVSIFYTIYYVTSLALVVITALITVVALFLRQMIAGVVADEKETTKTPIMS